MTVPGCEECNYMKESGCFFIYHESVLILYLMLLNVNKFIYISIYLTGLCTGEQASMSWVCTHSESTIERLSGY